MGNALYADISAFQPETIDWTAYKAWSEQGDGIARIALKASEGTGYTDGHYHMYRAQAQAAGIRIIHYHYARPEWNSAQAEANWFHTVVGSIGPNDEIMLDYEEGVGQATADWALAFLTACQQLFGKTPVIYSYLSYIQSRLQNASLASYPLILAEWTYDPSARPACPLPWKSYWAVQYSDKASVPGIAGSIDANVYVGGGNSMGIPQGWKDVNGVLIAPNNVPVHDGFRVAIENDPNFDPANMPNEAEYNANPVQLHRPDLGSGDRQTFRDDDFWWTAQMGVVREKYIGLELDAAYKQIATQTAQISQLQAEIATLKQQQPTINPDVAVELQTADAAIQKAESELKS